jgi:hypothetical protein
LSLDEAAEGADEGPEHAGNAGVEITEAAATAHKAAGADEATTADEGRWR